MRDPTRRQILGGAAAALAHLACARRPVRAPVDDRVRLDDPYCAEAPLDRLASRWVTPAPWFFVLDHGGVPAIDRASWRLELAGLVRRPRVLGFDDLARLPQVTLPATIACAGNRRREMHAYRDPLQWGAGAIGNAWWTGPRLCDVLAQAGVDPRARHVWLDGLDAADHLGGVRFGGSIPLARVLDDAAPPVVLAHAMNGRPLPPLHGHPVRAVVPGYIGARSVKWLGRIVVADRPSPNPCFTDTHRLAGAPIYDAPLNAAICAQAIAGPRARLAGYACAGSPTATVDTVELSIDGGRTWRAAILHGPAAPSCWRLWTFEPDRPARVLARAIDSTGAVQPRRAPWNADGYLYNAWPSARIR